MPQKLPTMVSHIPVKNESNNNVNKKTMQSAIKKVNRDAMQAAKGGAGAGSLEMEEASGQQVRLCAKPCA